MKVKDIVREAASALELTEAVKYCDGKNVSNGDTPAAGEEEAKELLKFFHRVETETAANYVPLVYEESVESVGGKIDTSSLSKRFLRAAYLLDKNGGGAQFKACPGYVKTAETSGVLGYAYLPEEKTLSDDSDFSSDELEKAFVAGVVAEYYLKKQLFEEFEVFRREYKAALSMARRLQNGRSFKARRWR
ncbi:MAG: hypothetical protein ACI4SH_02940 [Candidatus Scatosoma sp.]